MFQQIRLSKFSKFLVYYLCLMLVLETTAPFHAYALTEGPSQPEFNSFTPIGTSDMVDLASGDFNYNIPIMDVGGYPINLAYNSGVTMDQEASWVGLGWNLNVGQINRNVRGLPDDFRGDVVKTKNNIKTNVTVGVNPYLNVQIIGALDNVAGLNLGAGLDVQYNNYSGMNAVPSFGASFKFSDYVSVGMQLSSSVENGASVTPSVSLSTKKMRMSELGEKFNASLTPSVTYNSRQGLQSFNLSSTVGYQNHYNTTDDQGQVTEHRGSTSSSGSGSVSFLNNTFTPTKRLAFKNNNVRFSFSGGFDVWGVHGEASIAGYASVQKLVSKEVNQYAYGYENTEAADPSGLLDFNREKEQSSVSKNTMALPVTNYTYDLYTIQGQGIGGMFRPFRGQVGQVSDPRVTDQSASNSAGFEVEAGAGAHMGLNFRTTNTTSYTGAWSTVATPFFKEKLSGNAKDYERVYYKTIGETRVDQEGAALVNSLGGVKPITLKLDANKNAVNSYQTKVQQDNLSLLTEGQAFNSQITRQHRELRNQTIQKVTNYEAKRFSLTPFIKNNSASTSPDQAPSIPFHHTAGYIVTDANGTRHIYGETAYNKQKVEVTFAVRATPSDILPEKGLVKYFANDTTEKNNRGRDNYFNRVETPAYAHTYLLSSVLSPDYSDITGDGPTDDDLGTYTKFTYEAKGGDYQWRIPFEAGYASYNEGLKTDGLDQKGSYLYGKKENKYLKMIETKTHVAFFDIVERRDGCGVGSVNGGLGSGRMYYLKSIRLYSKPEVMVGGLVVDPTLNNPIKPIKMAHFRYDYSLSENIINNSGISQKDEEDTEMNEHKGKLTLKKVFFTYRNSNMGRYTPYEFFYESLNPEYHVKAYDIWGNYKPFEDGSWDINSPHTTPQEFPYVKQNPNTREVDVDKWASAWSLTSIRLPSGGKIKIDYEADDYKFVQDKQAMQMFKVVGVTNTPENFSPQASNDNLYNGSQDGKYVVIKIRDEHLGLTEAQILRKYTDKLAGKPIYFNFLVNMVGNQYDYVTGYFEMDDEAEVSNGHLFIPMKLINREGKNSSDHPTNPIAVAAWFFGRQNLNAQINGIEDPGGNVPSNVIDIGKNIVDNLEVMVEIFTGANGRLRDMNCAKKFIPQKSWIRLWEPNGEKVGGGSRVKQIVILDQWDKMLGINDNSPDIDRYAKQYGQQYDYNLDDGTSSGVATYEPNICKENPLVQPFYNKPEKLTGQTYQERPFGESFFPNPQVTYSKVTVSNVTASGETTKTGKVVTTHYTSFDFPTKTDFTNLDKSKIFHTNENEVIHNMLKGLLGLKINVKTDLTMSQGFSIETNDINGKVRKQEVFNNSNTLISSVEYKYATSESDDTSLDNNLMTVDENGQCQIKELATTYDIYNDLRESYAHTNSFGVAVNTDCIPLGIIPIIIGWGKPERSEHKQILRTAVTTKVIHKTAILKEKTAFDLGSTVYTKNHAWDAKTGQILLTETVNEYDDQYFTFNFPAYWYYKNMGLMSENIDFRGRFIKNPTLNEQNSTDHYFRVMGIGPDNGTQLKDYLKVGDELSMRMPQHKRVWVYAIHSGGNAVSLINSNGDKLTPQSFGSGLLNSIINGEFRVMRPIKRNQQMQSMASVTLMRNPIDGSGTISNSFLKTSSLDPRVINASAIEFSDIWESQCEFNLPQPGDTQANPYLFNIRGQWRPVKSYAYLTGRNAAAHSNTRKAGFFKTFNPFYKRNLENSAWEIDLANWTYASEVTKHNPYGVEIENKDALNRYSSAQYGYGYKLPIAVSSNSEYREMGFDGFEDYYNQTSPSQYRTHFGFNQSLHNPDAVITGNTSHTGRKSIAVKPGKSAVLNRKINGCTTE